MAHDWITQRLINRVADASAVYDNTKLYGFGWWFSYFWKEVSKQDEREALKAVLAMVFADQFPANIAVRPMPEQTARGNQVADEYLRPLPEPPDLVVRPQHYRELLTLLFHIGFREMPVALKTYEARRDALRSMFTDYIEANKRGGTVPLALAYRGETRDFATVIQHEGALNRVDLIHDSMNMHQPWHPFSDPMVGSKTYARVKSGDNCLYTVVSVASELGVSVGFPLIEDRNIYNLPALPPLAGEVDPRQRCLSRWNYALYRAAQPVAVHDRQPVLLARCTVSGVGRTSGVFLATDSFIYVVKVRKAVYTQHFVEHELGVAEGQCRERGVRGVRLKNFLAGAHVRRIHLGPMRTSGIVGFVQEVRYLVGGRWVPIPDPVAFAQEHFYGDMAAADVALNMIRRHLGRAAGGQTIMGEIDPGMAPNPVPTVTAIQQWNLSFDQFKSMHDHEGDQLYYGMTA